MNRRTLIILGGLFLGLLAVVIIQNTGVEVSLPGRTTATPEDPFLNIPRVFEDFTVLDIQAIRIQTPDGSSQLLLTRNEEGIWTAPSMAGELETETATLIARTLVLLPYYDTIPITEETNIAQFGFVEDNPLALSVETLLVDETPHAFLVGSLTRDQTGFYVLVDDRETIYVVEPRAIEFLRFQLTNPPTRLTSD
jgi:hypothetical protein